MAQARIDLDAVLAAACHLIDHEGIDELTLSNVAEALGVRPSALYTHIDGAGHLHHVVAIRATEGLTAHIRNAAVGVAGADAVRAIAIAYRDFAHRHPGQYAALVAPPSADGDDLADASASLNEVLALALRSLGTVDDGANRSATSLRSTLHGFVALEAIEAHVVDGDHFDHLVTVLIRGLAPLDTKP